MTHSINASYGSVILRGQTSEFSPKFELSIFKVSEYILANDFPKSVQERTFYHNTTLSELLS